MEQPKRQDYKSEQEFVEALAAWRRYMREQLTQTDQTEP